MENSKLLSTSCGCLGWEFYYQNWTFDKRLRITLVRMDLAIHNEQNQWGLTSAWDCIEVSRVYSFSSRSSLSNLDFTWEWSTIFSFSNVAWKKKRRRGGKLNTLCHEKERAGPMKLHHATWSHKRRESSKQKSTTFVSCISLKRAIKK